MDPPLRVREDWWVFEDPLRFKEALVGFRRSLKVQGSTGGFSKNLLGIKRDFSKAPFQALFSKK